MAPATGVITSSASRAGVSGTGACAAATATMITPNATRPTRRVATSITASWARALNGRTSSASRRPLRTYWRRRSTLPTARSAIANAQPASAVIRKTSANPKPPSVGVTRNTTRTLATSITPNIRLPTTSAANEARYWLWLRTWAPSRWRYAVSVGSATLDHQLALAAGLYPVAEHEDGNDPACLHAEQRQLQPGRAPFHEHVERNLDDRRERRQHGEGRRQRVGKEPHREVEPAQKPGRQGPEGVRAPRVQQPVRGRVDEVAASEADDGGQECRAHEQRIGDGASRGVELEHERAGNHGAHEAGDGGVAGAAEVGGEHLPDRIDRAQQISHHVTATDSLSELQRRPEQDHADQSLPRPHKGSKLGLVVPGHGVRTRVEDGEHHGEAEKAKHRVGDDGRHHRLTIGRVPLEPRRGQRQVRPTGRGKQFNGMRLQALSPGRVGGR